MHNIVIIGGNFGGVTTAHYLLRHVFPSLNAGSDKRSYKVTLISPSDHTYFKIVAPRALVSPEPIAPEAPFGSIRDGFAKYDKDEFTFIQGEAIGVDEVAKTVSVKSPGDSANSSVPYDSLVIATGTTSSSPLWTLHGEHTLTKAALEEMHKLVPAASSILIAGGGPTGVETAGEIASRYNKSPSTKKDITILSGTTRLLPRLKNPGVAPAAERQLNALGVTVVHNLKVTSSKRIDDKTELTFSDGSSRTVDLYIDATGGAPNTYFLPAAWLTDSKKVATDPSTLRATQAPAGVYAIGDAASYSKASVLDTVGAFEALGYSIWSDLRGEKAVSPVLKEKKYKPFEVDMAVVPVGPSGGVGALFGWKIPSWLVWLLKSRTFFIEKAEGIATGASYVK